MLTIYKYRTALILHHLENECFAFYVVWNGIGLNPGHKSAVNKLPYSRLAGGENDAQMFLSLDNSFILS